VVARAVVLMCGLLYRIRALFSPFFWSSPHTTVFRSLDPPSARRPSALEFVLAFPQSLAVRNRILREAPATLLPEEVLGLPKTVLVRPRPPALPFFTQGYYRLA